MATNLGSLVQLCCGEGGPLKTNLLAHVGGAHSGWSTLGLPQPKAACASRVHTAQAPGCSARALSQVDPVFCALPRSKPLRFLGALRGHRSNRLWVFCPSEVQATKATGCLVGERSYVVCASYAPPWSLPLDFPCVLWRHSPRCSVCLLWRADLRLWPSWCMQTIQDPRKIWSAAGSLLTVWWKMRSLGLKFGNPCLLSLVVAHLPLCLWEGRVLNGSQLVLLWFSRAQSFLLWGHQGSLCSVRTFCGKCSFCLYGNPKVWVAMSH